MASPRPTASPQKTVGTMVGLAGGLVLGNYAGINLLIPAGVALIVGATLLKIVGERRRPFVIAMAVQAGHAAWMALGAAVMNAWPAVLPDVAIIAFGVAWLVIAPGVIPVAVLALYHLFGLVINVQQISELALGDPMHRALTVHIAFRALAIGSLLFGLYRSRYPASPPDQTEEIVLAEPAGTPAVETFNPYQSPAAAALSLGQAIQGAGPWRHGNDLVVRIGQSQLPPFCIKTNQPTEGMTKHVVLEWVPNQAFWVIVMGALGHWIARSLYGVKVPLDLPLTKEWLDQRRKAVRPGWLAAALGVFFLIGGTVVYVFAVASGAVPEQSAAWLMIPIFCGPLIAIAGVIYLVIRDRPLVKIRRVEDSFAWLSGASPDFLNRLPYWEA